jgi:hypothetical protein
VDFTVHDFDGRMILPLASILTTAREFSFRAFGTPGSRPPIQDPTLGVRNHIRKELAEVDREPHDLEEWIDVAILAFDGAFRAGYTPLQVAAALTSKYHKNTQRKWGDYRKLPPGAAVEHVRSAPVPDPTPQIVPRHPKELVQSSSEMVPEE